MPHITPYDTPSHVGLRRTPYMAAGTRGRPAPRGAGRPRGSDQALRRVDDVLLLREVARRLVRGGRVRGLEALGDRQQRHLGGALVLRLPAARTEAAARRRVGRRRDVTAEDDPLAALA